MAGVLIQWSVILSFQEAETSCVGPTASSLFGDAAPSLGKLHAPLPEDVEALERLRHRLQVDWKLLQTTGEFTTEASHNNITHNVTSTEFKIHLYYINWNFCLLKTAPETGGGDEH